MAFDGLFTYSMTNELNELIAGARIHKIHQPYSNEMILHIRGKGKTHKLLLSAHSMYARVQLTEETYENPSEPPMFCMLMRKHLEGYVIEGIRQYKRDRIMIIDIKGRNEIGDPSPKQVWIEIMGRHSNIVLIDPNKNTIIDSIKHLSYAVNSHRAVMPGFDYVLPPEQNKLDPFFVGEDDILRSIDWNSGKMDQQLVKSFAGLSPLVAKEIVKRTGLPTKSTLPPTFTKVMEELKEMPIPTLTEAEGKEFFSILSLTHKGGSESTFSSLSTLLDRFYFGKAERERVKQHALDVERLIRNEWEKNKNKLVKLEKTLDDAHAADKYQKLGELLTANLYMVQRGMDKVEVVDYYDPDGKTVEIPLDQRLTPSENAQRLFSKYQKAKNAIIVVLEQIEKTKLEVNYFDQLIQQLESASPRDIEEIREELMEGGYIRARQGKQKKQKPTKPVLEEYKSSTGVTILAGKNNKQNDFLTNRVAKRDNIWLHTKDIPGSHVVIQSTEPDETTLMEAANIAAFYSKAKESSSVPVDFTAVRHVKKPSGAKPGFVIYDNQQTLYVTPNADLIRGLYVGKQM